MALSKITAFASNTTKHSLGDLMLRGSLKTACILSAVLAGCASQKGSHATTQPISAGPSAHNGKATALVSPDVAQRLYERVRPTLVAVQYTFNGELGRTDIIGPGIVVGGDGLIMVSLAMTP